MGLDPEPSPERRVVDVIVLPDADAALIRESFATRDTRTALANSSIGIAVRSGTPKPDVSSVDALKRTLLQPKSSA